MSAPEMRNTNPQTPWPSAVRGGTPELKAREAVAVTISIPADWMPRVEQIAAIRHASRDPEWMGQIMQKISIAHARNRARAETSGLPRAGCHAPHEASPPSASATPPLAANPSA